MALTPSTTLKAYQTGYQVVGSTGTNFVDPSHLWTSDGSGNMTCSSPSFDVASILASGSNILIGEVESLCTTTTSFFARWDGATTYIMCFFDIGAGTATLYKVIAGAGTQVAQVTGITDPGSGVFLCKLSVSGGVGSNVVATFDVSNPDGNTTTGVTLLPSPLTFTYTDAALKVTGKMGAGSFNGSSRIFGVSARDTSGGAPTYVNIPIISDSRYQVPFNGGAHPGWSCGSILEAMLVTDNFGTAGIFYDIKIYNYAKAGSSLADWLPGQSAGLNTVAPLIATLSPTPPFVYTAFLANDAGQNETAMAYGANYTTIQGVVNLPFRISDSYLPYATYPDWTSDQFTLAGSYAAVSASLISGSPTHFQRGDVANYSDMPTTTANYQSDLLHPSAGQFGPPEQGQLLQSHNDFLNIKAQINPSAPVTIAPTVSFAYATGGASFTVSLPANASGLVASINGASDIVAASPYFLAGSPGDTTSIKFAGVNSLPSEGPYSASITPFIGSGGGGTGLSNSLSLSI